VHTGSAANGKSTPDNSLNADGAGELSTAQKSAKRAHGEAIDSGASLQTTHEKVARAVVKEDTGTTTTGVTDTTTMGARRGLDTRALLVERRSPGVIYGIGMSILPFIPRALVFWISIDYPLVTTCEI